MKRLFAILVILLLGVLLTPTSVSATVDHLVDYLIITTDSLVDAFQPLADWKIQKGIFTEIVTTSWIYETYPGADRQEQIKNCIMEYHYNQVTKFVLLGGDTAIVPTQHIDYPYPCLSDNYYSCLDDFLPIVSAGRAPVVNTHEVEIFVDKVLRYEKPAVLDYQSRAVFMSSNLGIYLGTADFLSDQLIEHYYEPLGFYSTKLYESEGTLSRASVLEALNEGYNLVFLYGHGYNIDSVGVQTGTLGTEWIWGNDLDSLTNSERPSIMYSSACFAGDFGIDHSFGERFVLAPNGGFFIGPSYGSLGSYPSDLSVTLAEALHYMDATERDLSVGTVLVMAKRYAWAEYLDGSILNLLGDPEMPIYTKEPDSLIVTHFAFSDVFPGYLYFSVMVEDSTPVGRTKFCVMKKDSLLSYYYTDFTIDGCGLATLSIDQMETWEGDTLLLTVIKQNCTPCETLIVIPPLEHISSESMAKHPLSLSQNAPNPFNSSTTISFELPESGPVNLLVFDTQGRLVVELANGNKKAGAHTITWDASDVPSGIYFAKLITGSENRSIRMILVK